MADDDETYTSVEGIQNVRNTVLELIKSQDWKQHNYTEYEVHTHKDKQILTEDNSDPYTKSINSIIFCDKSFTIKQPKRKDELDKLNKENRIKLKSYMHKENGKKRFAYAVGMFPDPKKKKATYLDGCILAALGLRRQKTEADTEFMLYNCGWMAERKIEDFLKEHSEIIRNNNNG